MCASARVSSTFSTITGTFSIQERYVMPNFTKKPVFGSKYRYMYTCTDCIVRCVRIADYNFIPICPYDKGDRAVAPAGGVARPACYKEHKSTQNTLTE